MPGSARLAALLLLAALTVSCGGKAAATKALAAAESAYAKIAAEAASVAPDQAAELEGALASARADLVNGDYDAVLPRAVELADQVDSLAQALPGLRDRLQADWKALAVAVPGAIAALDRKLEDFGEPPAGMPGRAAFDKARAELQDLRARWTEAESLTGTSLAKAVAMGDQVRYDAMKSLTEFQQQGS